MEITPVHNSWFDPLRDIKSLGETSARPGSLAGLAAARTKNLSQYFTPDEIATLMWRLVVPAAERARGWRSGKVSILDNAIGKGSLIQFADPARHFVAGVDVHGESIEALGRALADAGIEHDLLQGDMAEVSPKRFDCALANPPFSVHLQSVHLEPYGCTSYGRFGPSTSAMSHPYALAQVMDAAAVGAVLLPRSFAHEAWVTHEHRDRLHALVDLPSASFSDQGTLVEVSILIFGAPGCPRRQHVTLSNLDDQMPALALDAGWRKERRGPKALARKSERHAVQSITLPVTGDAHVRVFRAGRNIRLDFRCGLIQAKVLNALLRGPVERSDLHRYPTGVRYRGEGQLLVGAYLVQDDPMGCLQKTIDLIATAGGAPSVDPGLLGYMRRQAKRMRIERTPFRHVVPADASTLAAGSIIDATAKVNVLIAPKVWGGPIIRAGTAAPFSWDGQKYRHTSTDGKHTLELEPRDFAAKFDAAPTAAKSDKWVAVHEGRLVDFPELAHQLRQRFEARRLDGLASWEFQTDDVIELATSRGAVYCGEMGCGKSRVASSIALMGGRHNALVVEPHLIDEMTDELVKAGLDRSLWQVIESYEQATQLRALNILSYNTLRKQLREGSCRTFAHLLRRRFHTVACDEAHALKTEDSLRTQAVWQLSPKRRYAFTGTPIPNLVQDLIGLAGWACRTNNPVNPYGRRGLYLEPRLLTSMEFCDRAIDRFTDQHVVMEWCTAEFADGLVRGGRRQVPKINNVQALRHWLAPFMKRRIVAEPEVSRHFKAPKCTQSVTTLDWDLGHLAYFLKVADEFSERYRRAKEDAVASGKSLNMVTLLARINAVFKAGNQPSHNNALFGPYAPMTSKERYLVKRAVQLAGQGRKIILYVDGPQLSERLAAAINERGVQATPFHGQMTIKHRTRRLNTEFRYGPGQVLVASFGTGQTGLNLYQSDYVLMGVRAWNGKTERQAVARTLRPQQTREVHVEFVHLGGSLDEYQAQTVRWKTISEFEAIDLLEPEEVLEDYVHLDEIINSFVKNLAALHGQDGHKYRQELIANAA
ncbi:SNF2-related protein (plasmid) [Xanthomonas sontii]|uniref:SNF2-related protein n=1 Tax=Xanthomonas sontii TaxID=2650745 RepID=UPI003F846577